MLKFARTCYYLFLFRVVFRGSSWRFTPSMFGLGVAGHMEEGWVWEARIWVVRNNADIGIWECYERY